jgi:hypothetical protein
MDLFDLGSLSGDFEHSAATARPRWPGLKGRGPRELLSQNGRLCKPGRQLAHQLSDETAPRAKAGSIPFACVDSWGSICEYQ